MKTYQPHRSSIGDVAANLIVIFCYVVVLVFWTFGSVFLLGIFLCEKKSGMVRFHAVQAFLFWLVRLILGGGIAYESLAALLTGNENYLYMSYGWMSGSGVVALRICIDIIFILLAVVTSVYAYQWKIWKIPAIGQIASWIISHSVQVKYNGEDIVPVQCRILSKNNNDTDDWSYVQTQYANQIPKPKVEALSEVDKNDMMQRIYRQTTREDEHQNSEKSQNKIEEQKSVPVQKEQSKRTYMQVANKKDYVNNQLPKEMRDAPADNDSQSERQKRERRIPEMGSFSGANTMVSPTLIQKTEDEDLDATFEQKMLRQIYPSLNIKPWRKKSEKVLPTTDPNHSLPPDMRDGPMWQE